MVDVPRTVRKTKKKPNVLVTKTTNWDKMEKHAKKVRFPLYISQLTIFCKTIFGLSGRAVLGVRVSDRWTPTSEEDGHGQMNTPQLF